MTVVDRSGVRGSGRGCAHGRAPPGLPLFRRPSDGTASSGQMSGCFLAFSTTHADAAPKVQAMATRTRGWNMGNM
ncbi:hypothetical protein [Bordetella pertussis]|uniref:hypothetical protein n=1 Tax=Bordetella pertussis TaxID=520 RepID=UPI0032079F5F